MNRTERQFCTHKNTPCFTGEMQAKSQLFRPLLVRVNTLSYICTQTNIYNMETIVKRPTSLRLREDLLNELKERAKSSHRSLSNFIETLLWDSIYYEPNEITIEAMIELKANKLLKSYSCVEELEQSIMYEEA